MSCSSLFNKKIKTGFIYTMNVSDGYLKDVGYTEKFKRTEMTMKNIFGSSEFLAVTDTYQFDDYSKYETSAIDVQGKVKRNSEIFLADYQKAFDMGVRFVQE